ncbi:MAG: DUF58 domain-containing protein [Salinivirgaceae bacterium]|nr:DUF58 domain-containing protein [Salinivirgaceae bacterium]MBO7594257.1 DUF58 domain-containing protein [Salinivirgaceae bacterium]
MNTLQEIIEFEKFDHLEWCARQIVEGFITGQHKSPYHGFSVEFAEHRLYNQGESTKHIDWKLFGRTDKLFVKRFEEETNMRCNILIDVSASMNFPANQRANKLAFSVYSAAALIHLLRRQRDAVGLTFFSNGIDFQTESKLSEAHAKMLYAELNRLLTGGFKPAETSSTDVAGALHLIAEKMRKRSLIILFSDLFTHDSQALFSAFEHLKHNKHEVVVFSVTDNRYELELLYPNRPVCFVDMETGERIKLNPNEIRDKYQQSLKSFESELREKCAQYNIEFMNVDIAQPFDVVLTEFLIKRQKIN